MKKHILYLVIFILLLTSACQSNQLVNNNPTNTPIPENQQKNEPPDPKPTSTLPPDPTETPIPTQVSTPTRDPMRISFSTQAHFLYNLQGGGPIVSMAWYPDSTLYAHSGIESALIWDIKTLNHAYILTGHEDVIIDLGWSPDGSLFATLSLDETIRLWAAPDYEETAILQTGPVNCFDWSPDGEMIAAGTRTGEIQLWDIASREVQEILQDTEENAVFQIIWSPDGKMLATADSSGAVNIWSLETKELVNVLVDADGSPANDLAWSPNGQYLATAHQNGMVHLWNPETWEIVRSIEALKDGVKKIAWSPDSLMIATGGFENSVPIWEVGSGNFITGVGTQNELWSLCWSPNGNYLTVGSSGYTSPSAPGYAFDNTSGSIFEGYSFEANSEAGIVYFYIRK